MCDICARSCMVNMLAYRSWPRSRMCSIMMSRAVLVKFPIPICAHRGSLIEDLGIGFRSCWKEVKQCLEVDRNSTRSS